MAGALSKLVNLTSLYLGGTWNVEWVVSCGYVVCCVCVGFGCRGKCAVCGVCGCTVRVHTHSVAYVGGVWGTDNSLGAKGAASVAGALSKLVNLTSLYLGSTCNVEWVVSCMCGTCV